MVRFFRSIPLSIWILLSSVFCFYFIPFNKESFQNPLQKWSMDISGSNLILSLIYIFPLSIVVSGALCIDEALQKWRYINDLTYNP